MQVYRGMDIGTAKPTETERNRVSHHLFDLVNPDETYSVGRFVRESEEVIKKLKLRKKIPILVGGTGMYLRSLLFGLSQIPEVSSNIKLQVKKWQKEEGTPSCWQKLKEVDLEGAEKLHPNDTSRIMRALEVVISSGQPISSFQDNDNSK